MPTLISENVKELTKGLRQRALAEGFDGVRITAARLPSRVGEDLAEFVENGLHGDMAWMAETIDRRRSPERMWMEAKSAILMALSYTPDHDPLERLRDKRAGIVSVYALNRDYHDLIKGKLKRVAQWLARASGHEVKVFVDTAPLMEKPLAAQAGLGWQGKHTNLVSRDLGSWFFIGSILTTCELACDTAEIDHCGSCRACLDICPTRAFPAPYKLDARRCISYLTIEHKGHIAREFRKSMGNRIFGCDDCLAICPWNKFAKTAREVKLRAREDWRAPSLGDLLQLDDGAFRALFSGSPVKRIGRDRFIRNCLIAAGNSGEPALEAIVRNLLGDASPLVRAMAAWALRQLADNATFEAMKAQHMNSERDADVRSEWEAA